MGQSEKEAVRPDLPWCFSLSSQTGHGHDGSGIFQEVLEMAVIFPSMGM